MFFHFHPFSLYNYIYNVRLSRRTWQVDINTILYIKFINSTKTIILLLQGFGRIFYYLHQWKMFWDLVDILKNKKCIPEHILKTSYLTKAFKNYEHFIWYYEPNVRWMKITILYITLNKISCLVNSCLLTRLFIVNSCLLTRLFSKQLSSNKIV